MSLFADNIMVYVVNPPKSEKTTLFELLMEYVMLSGYKISNQMSIHFYILAMNT